MGRIEDTFYIPRKEEINKDFELSELGKYKAVLFALARVDIMKDFLEKHGDKVNSLQALDVAAVHTMAIYFRDLDLKNLYQSYEEALEEVKRHEGPGWKEVDGKL